MINSGNFFKPNISKELCKFKRIIRLDRKLSKKICGS